MIPKPFREITANFNVSTGNISNYSRETDKKKSTKQIPFELNKEQNIIFGFIMPTLVSVVIWF